MPVTARKKPEPYTGEQLELELVGGSAVPRPARSRGTARASEPGKATPPVAPPEPGPNARAASPGRAGRGTAEPPTSSSSSCSPVFGLGFFRAVAGKAVPSSR